MISEYGIESLPMGEELRSLLPNMPMVSKPLLTMGTTKCYMVEQIIDRDGDVVYKHEADPVCVYSPATATIIAGSSCAGLLRLVPTT